MRRSSLWLLALVALVACKKEEKEAEPTPIAVRVATAARTDVREIVEASGTLEAPPGMDVKLGALAAGRIGQVLVAEGDKVAQGQLLARLEATSFKDALAQSEAALAQARAQDANARAKLERTQKAFEAGVAAGQEVDDARLQAATAHAAVRTSEAAASTTRNQLNRSELRAPFAGVVAHVFAAAGEPTDAGKPIVEVARTTALELHAPLPPRRAVLVRKGQTALLHVDGIEAPLEGVVAAVAPVIDPTTGAAMVRIRVENPSGALKGGAVARARIVADVHHGVLAVPRDALLAETEPGQTALEVVADGDKAKRTPVELGYQDEALAEITSGLAEGARVVVQGAYALPDGTPLKIESGDGGAEGEAGAAHEGGAAHVGGAAHEGGAAKEDAAPAGATKDGAAGAGNSGADAGARSGH